MAIARVQATPIGAGSGVGSLTLNVTFNVSPAAGNLIVVAFATSGGDNSPVAVTVTDNQGNTYHSAGAPLPTNGADSYIYYAWNVAASGGTFTVTAHKTTGAGSSAGEIRGCAIEWSGFSTTDPLVGFGHSSSASCSTVATGTPESAVVAVVSGLRLNFDITSITVGVQSPAFTQEWERLSSTPFGLIGEADSRVSSSAGVQSASWTINTNPTGVNSMIAAFYAAPPVASLRLTQLARDLLEQQSTTTIRLTQLSREVLYPFTCTPGPSPVPATGCPEGLSPNPVTAPGGRVPTM